MSELFDEIGTPIQKAEIFEQYRAALLRENKTVNLTAITDPEEVEIKHFIDSLLLLRSAQWKQSAGGSKQMLRVADVGSGAGFPGVPLAIVCENVQLDCLEASRKRSVFILRLAKELKLHRMRAVHIRAEEAGRNPQYRESYEWVVSRAVAPMPVLLEYCLPLVKIGGCFAAYKGAAESGEEDDAIAQRMGGRLADVLHATLPMGKGERQIRLFKKLAHTPAQYPRRPGIPAKTPLA